MQRRALPTAFALPGLKPLMQHTAGDTKPIPMYRFPLTACPQHILNLIEDTMVVYTGPPTLLLLRWLRKFALENAPQISWHTKIVWTGWFCVRIFYAWRNLAKVVLGYPF